MQVIHLTYFDLKNNVEVKPVNLRIPKQFWMPLDFNVLTTSFDHCHNLCIPL